MTNMTYKVAINSLLIMIIIFLITGCARWPDGGDQEKKLLLIKVEINESGTINPELGRYYIVFDTREDASNPPSYDRADWHDDYYYIVLDNMGFCFGRWGSTCQYTTSIGNIYDNYFQVNLELALLGNPEKIYMNVVTTDYNDQTYDYVGNPSDLTIDTSLSSFNKIVQDFPGAGDSSGGPDFDIIRITLVVS